MLIETVGPARDKIRFFLDPLAEYLAGLYTVERFRSNQELWWEFLTQIDSNQGDLKEIREFLNAIRECCVARADELNIPEFVIEQLAAWRSSAEASVQ